MTIEGRVRDALQAADAYAPSPDLFAKVVRSIEDYHARRTRVRRTVGAIGGLVVATGAFLALLWDAAPQGNPLPWWSIVVVLEVTMAAIIVGVGPAIRRFGRSYVEDVFRTSPATGLRFLSLLDIAYYLVFAAYALLWVPFRPEQSWVMGADALATMLQQGVLMVGGLLLLMGVLHALTIAVLPFIGLVFTSTRHRIEVPGGKQQWSPEVWRAHRTVNVVLIVAVILLVWQIGGLLVGLVLAGTGFFG